MWSKTLIVVLISIILLAQAPAALAQRSPAAGAWDSVASLSQGSELAVKLKDGRTVKGRFSGATDATLTLAGKDGPVSLNRADILTVHQVTRKSGGNSALVGAALGAAVGVAAGAGIKGNNSTKSAGVVPVIGGAGAGIGALFGSLFGSGQKRVLIYRIQ